MTEITLYNTRTRAKQPFRPLDPSNVRMYVCGPTVYDRAHIGNARPVVVFDVLFRLLRHVYGEDHVTYVRNITDVDDKIIARAAETGRPIGAITEETIAWYREDMAALGALPPTHEPRATGFIAPMVAMIEALVAKGHAYAAEGHVLFAVASYPDYGKLARRSLDEMRAGSRVEVAPYKRDPMDFVLWKPSDAGQPGWESPWGRGRPGWHIECSAMAHELLGASFDIHGGGIDLVFPHHENEVAQSMCAHPEGTFASVWMHNGFLNVEGEKMSKSLGNFFTVRDLLDQGIPGEVMRFVLLSSHYRQPMDWTERKAEEARATLDRWSEVLASYQYLFDASTSDAWVSEDVVHALANDLNTAQAIAELHALATKVSERDETSGDEYSRNEKIAKALISGCDLIGLPLAAYAKRYLASEQFMSVDERLELEQAWVKATIHALIEERDAARRTKNFGRADQIRDGLLAAGVEIQDTPSGAEWSLGPRFDPARLEVLA